MSRARDLFERLRVGQSDALDELIADREPESLFLDFKRSPNKGVGRLLSPDDNKNLAKAVSGFANSSGGVLIWGVDCRRDPSGAEVAEKRPLSDAHGFNTKIQSAISRVTIPPHPGVEVISFEEPRAGPAGYVIVHVPQSLIGPTRSVSSNHYHLRTGSDFGIVPHDVLAGMFGRAPQPSVDLNLLSHPTRLDGRPGHLTLACGLVAINLGAVVGDRPYLSAFYGDFPGILAAVTPDREFFSVRRGKLPSFSVVAKPGLVLAPGGSEHICDIVLDIPLGQPCAIHLQCTLGVLGAPPRRFSLDATKESVADAFARAQVTGFPSSDILRLVPEG